MSMVTGHRPDETIATELRKAAETLSVLLAEAHDAGIEVGVQVHNCRVTDGVSKNKVTLKISRPL